MVLKVRSQYNKKPPSRMGHGTQRLIGNTVLYPGALNCLRSGAVAPVTETTVQLMSLHLLDHADLRKWVELALTKGTYINSQWCSDNSGSGIYACDSYVVTGLLYIPSVKQEVLTDVYVKISISKTGNTVAVISLHPSV